MGKIPIRLICWDVEAYKRTAGTELPLWHYLLEGGVKGRFFSSSSGIYEVVGIGLDDVKRQKKPILEIHYLNEDSCRSVPLNFHFEDEEAPPEEVREAKESALPKITQHH